MPLRDVETQVANTQLQLPALPQRWGQDAELARWYQELRQAVQDRDAEIERRLKVLEAP